jgi:ABC-type transport system involved in cytochrome c biogenesis permease subunit/predicted secreted protein
MKKNFQKWLPPLLMLAMALWFFGQLQAPKEKDFAFTEFGRLPITANGRIEPMDSLARNALLEIREKQTLNTEPWKDWNQHPTIISATEWLATLMMNPAAADAWPVFRIDHPDLVSLLKLPERDPASQSDGKDYSWNQIQPMLDELGKQNDRVQKIEAAERSPYENAIAKMTERVQLYATLRNTVQPAGVQNWPEQVDAFEKLIPDGVAAAQAQQAGQPYSQTNFTIFAAFIQEFQFMTAMEPPLILPPDGPDQWRRMGEALLNAPHAPKPVLDASIHDYARMAGALAANQPAEFNAALVDLRSQIIATQPKAVAKARAEVFFNQMEPFYYAMVIYVCGALLVFLFWIILSETLRRSAEWLIWLAFAIHTTGLIYRMVLEGRPPVTNLYSSAIFIGWGACLLGLILERFHKNGIGLLMAAGIGFITLIIAHHLARAGDTMEMMRAVLDTNFWLATHVVAVTVGYASTFAAGFLGLLYVFLGVFTPRLKTQFKGGEVIRAGIAIGALAGGAVGAAVGGAVMKKSTELGDTFGKSICRMIYGIVCFATLFSFVGTVLGGIWADQSWGRFWGWDPKENGALIIVLWNALILHLRWGGLIRERGLVNCAIFGNVVTAWSWFGVNMLGIGLHSYGFTEAAFKWLVLFVVSQLAFIVLGSLPLRMWRSFCDQAETKPPMGMKPKPAH